jgi:hypothetical protein
MHFLRYIAGRKCFYWIFCQKNAEKKLKNQAFAQVYHETLKIVTESFFEFWQKVGQRFGFGMGPGSSTP